jgi:hypothetical protein
MAAPETQFQQAGISASGYSPTVTQLAPPIRLEGSGALWAQVGKTAMDAASQAGEMLQKSPLNPAVRAAINYNVDQYKRAQEVIQKQRDMGPYGYITSQVGPGGLSTVSPAQITDPTLAQGYLSALQKGYIPPVTTKDGGPPGPPAPGTGGDQDKKPAQPVQQPTNQGPELIGGTPPPAPAAPPPQNGPPAPGDMGKPTASADIWAAPGQPPAAPSFQGPDQAQTAAAVQDALRRNQFASNQPGVPAGYQPPSGPDAQAQEAQRQQQLQQWQAQNAHPVASASDALKWAKQFHTGYTDATYLPHGGPAGEPAFNFTGKNGASNIVPISQMVRNGFGPTVASSNTSSVLNVADQITKAGQGPQGPGLPFGPVSPAQPQPGQPPPAPGPPGQPPQQPGQPVTDVQGNPLSAYTNVPSRGGLSPGQLSADTSGAGQPAQPSPAQQPPAIPNLSDADQKAIQDKANAMPEPEEGKGDTPISYPGSPILFYRDNSPQGRGPDGKRRVYSLLPSDPGQYYNPMRWYLGTKEYRAVELPESEMRRNMDYWVKAGYKSPAEVENMSAEQMKPWLRNAWEQQNFSRSPTEGGINMTLDKIEDLHNTVNRIQDIERTLGENGKPALNEMDRSLAEAKAWAERTGSHAPLYQQSPPQFVGTSFAAPISWLSGLDNTTSKTILDLQQQVGHVRDLLASNPELNLTPGKTQGLGIPAIGPVPIPDVVPTDVLDMFTGRNYKENISRLNGYQNQITKRYGDLVGGTHEQRQHIDPRHQENVDALNAHGDLPDVNNQYRNRLFTVSEDDYPEFAAHHPNTPFIRADTGQRFRTPNAVTQ